MSQLLQIVAIAMVAVVANVAHAHERHLDCSGVIETSTLDAYKDVCHYVDRGSQESYNAFSIMNRMDIVEMCTCNLLRHGIAWQAMLTHEVETLFHVTKKLVDSSNSEAEENLYKSSLVLQNDSDKHMYFWDRFNALLRSTDPESEGAELSKKLFDLFAESYYNPDTFTMPFKGASGSMNLRRIVSSSCKQLLGQFELFLKYFNNLRLISENPRFVYRIVNYDETLYRLVGVIKMCQFMTLAGELI